MTRFFLRIITDCVTQAAEQSIFDFLRSLPGIHTEPIKPYWKQSEQVELVCSFNSPISVKEIQALLADCWEDDVADSRWSCIHVPHVVFLWLTT